MDLANSGQSSTKSERFNLRVSPFEKSLLEAAAEMSHMSTSQFMLQAALRYAEATVIDKKRFAVPAEKWDALMERLEQPAREIPELKRAVAAQRMRGDEFLSRD